MEGLILSDFRKSPILSAYADDIIAIVKNQKEINELGRIVNEFKTVSAARVNWGKSEALAVGSWEGGLPSLPGGGKVAKGRVEIPRGLHRQWVHSQEKLGRGGGKDKREYRQVEVAKTTTIVQRQDTDHK